ncbi:MAG: CHAT domain-containing protein [Deltaproteobacteria bacterium]|jgi:CHAT domain-containing protein/tetratricopeptide (TPR) repeat protein|nr:CHAT domain-containing protein [Deltaproteobacteria bacterium]
MSVVMILCSTAWAGEVSEAPNGTSGAVSGKADDRPYRPAWKHEAMSPELEAERSRAEALSDARDDEEAAGAWGELARKVAGLYGEGDGRAVAAKVRAVRYACEAQTDGCPDCEAVAGLAREAGRAFGEDSEETMFAEFSQAGLLSRTDPRGAVLALERISGKVLSVFGRGHPAAVAALLELAVARGIAGDVPSAVSGVGEIASECAGSHVLGCSDVQRYSYLAAALAMKAGDIMGAEAALRSAYETGKSRLGLEHPLTLETESNLGHVLREAGSFREARALLEHAAAASEALHGRHDAASLRALNNLAAVMRGQGDLGEAEALFREILGAQRETNGPDHRLTLATASNLAIVMNDAGNFRQAATIHRNVLEALTRTLGPLDPETLQSAGNLAAALMDAGKTSEARELIERTVNGLESSLPPGHYRTIQARASYALTLAASGDVPAALEQTGRALAEAESSYGPDHPVTLLAAGNLASVHKKVGNHGRARELYRRCSEANARRLGPGHPETLVAQNNMATAMMELGDLEGAGGILSRTLEEAESVLGQSHAVTLSIKNNLSVVLSRQGDWDRAVALVSGVADGMATSLGPEHPWTLEPRLNLGSFMAQAGRATEAREMLAGVLEATVRVEGSDSWLSASAAANLGRAAALAGDLPSSIFFLKVSVASVQRTRATLSTLERALRRSYINSVQGHYRDLIDLLISEGRNAEALAVLGLLKEEEAAGLDRAAWTRGPDASGGEDAGETEPDLFGGTRDAAAWADYLTAAGKLRSLETERKSLSGRARRTGDQGLQSASGEVPGSGQVSGTKGGVAALQASGPESSGAAGHPSGPGGVGAAGQFSSPGDDGAAGQASGPGSGGAAGQASGPGGGGAAGQSSGPGDVGVAGQSSGPGAWAAGPASDPGLDGQTSEPGAGAGTLSPGEAARLEELGRETEASGAAFIALCLDMPARLAGADAAPAPDSWAARSLAARQAAIAAMGEGAALLHAVSADETLHLALVTKDSVVVRSSAVSREELTGLARKFRAAVMDFTHDPRPAARRLYDAVLAPAEGDLEAAGVRNLMLSLDGELRYAPVAAMWDGERWLAERWALSLFTESTPLRIAEDSRPGPPSVRALGVTAAWPGFSALPGVESEIAAVVKTPDTPDGALDGEARLDRSFDRKALSDALASGAPVTHVASHFRLDPDSLDNTALLLGDGTTISLKDFAAGGDLDFRGLDLLTLSACDTASAARGGEGREVESLGETVQRAGASAVLATLMPVADSSAPDLMREFYRLRYVEGRDKAEALRGSQMLVMSNVTPSSASVPGAGSHQDAVDRPGISCAPGTEGSPVSGDDMRGIALSAAGANVQGTAGAAVWEGEGFSHPYYWSSFVLMGSWK